MNVDVGSFWHDPLDDVVVKVVAEDGADRVWIELRPNEARDRCSFLTAPCSLFTDLRKIDKLTALISYGWVREEVSERTQLFNNRYWCSTFKSIPKEVLSEFERVVKSQLHGARDTMRIRGIDTRHVPWDINAPEYCQAFGMMLTLQFLGYGYFGSSNLDGSREKADCIPEHNLRWWFRELEQQVLIEEGYLNEDGSRRDPSEQHISEYCKNRYRSTPWPGTEEWDKLVQNSTIGQT